MRFSDTAAKLKPGAAGGRRGRGGRGACVRWPWLLVCLIAGSPAVAENTALTDAEVTAAAARMRDWLYARQDAAGTWEGGGKAGWKTKHPAGGVTALATYALLAAGESHQDPRLDRALAYLRAAEPRGTYAVSLRAHVWARLPASFADALSRDAAWLRAAHAGGYFDYGSPPRARRSGAVPVNSSLSRTQYGALGLWEAAKRGETLPVAYWRDTAELLVRSQLPGGGWNYGPGTGRSDTPADGGMTCAGITLLCVARQQLADGPGPARKRRGRADAGGPEASGGDQITAAIERGLMWLDEHFDGGPVTQRDRMNAAMFWYGVERVGLATGRARLGGRDWFVAGARHILARERDGQVKPVNRTFSSDVIETAFSLAFLARGRVPVWASELSPPGTRDARPDDLTYLTTFLSDAREAELSWTRAEDADTPEAWRRAPVLWWSGAEPVTLEEGQAAAVRRYLELGGLLVINGEGRGRRAFAAAARRQCEAMFPGRAFARPAADGPLAKLVVDVGGPPPCEVLSNGVRPLVVLTRGDWGRAAGGPGPPPQDAAARAVRATLQNLYAAVSDRGELTPRLEHPLGAVPDAATAPAGAGAALRVAVGVRSAAPPPEPAAWAGVSRRAARHGRRVSVETIALSDLHRLDTGVLLHLADAGPEPCTNAERVAVAAFVRRGGGVLLETAGGRTGFATDEATRLARVLNATVRPVAADDPVLTGGGRAGGTDRRRVRWRRYVRAEGDGPPGPSLGELRPDGPDGPDGTGRVVVSGRDLSLGGLGCGWYPVNGYATDDARGLLLNVLLDAAAAGRDNPRPEAVP